MTCMSSGVVWPVVLFSWSCHDFVSGLCCSLFALYDSMKILLCALCCSLFALCSHCTRSVQTCDAMKCYYHKLKHTVILCHILWSAWVRHENALRRREHVLLCILCCAVFALSQRTHGTHIALTWVCHGYEHDMNWHDIGMTWAWRRHDIGTTSLSDGTLNIVNATDKVPRQAGGRIPGT